MKLLSSFAALGLYFLPHVFALAVSSTKSAKRAQVILADGTSMQYGSSLDGLKWQSSGVLIQGCNNINITDCYSLRLDDDPNSELDPGGATPRQRIEFLTETGADGTSHTYSWKYYLSSQTGTSTHFFHLMQIFSDGDSGPVITLDAIQDTVAIQDHYHDCPSSGCPSVALDDFTDRVTLHSMSVTYGSSGKMSYMVKNMETGETLISYSASGSMGSDGSYVKFGEYRATFDGMTIALAALGDFSGSDT